MQPVLPMELAGKSVLEYDLYNEKGELLYKKGEPVPYNLVLKYNDLKKIFYKLEYDFKLEDFDLEPVPEKIENKPASIFSDKTQEKLLVNSKKIVQTIVDGDSIDMKSCDEMTKILVDDVSSKIDKIKGINELKVYDRYTFSHTVNVSSMSTALGLILKLKEEEIKELSLGALLHDVGKILIPREVLLKPGKLDPEEFEVIKTHTSLGYQYVKSKNNIDEKVARVALDHQEKFSGIGYPNGLKKDEITYYAQIVSIIDVYDALTSARVYKPPMANAEAIRIMLSDGSKSFNPYMLYRFVYLANYKDSTSLVE